MRAFVLIAPIALLGGSAFAQDAGAVFKSKCASCRNTKGEGRSAMKGTNMLTDEAKKMTDDQMVDRILNGGAEKKAHAFGTKGIIDDQAKALVAYIRTMQK